MASSSGVGGCRSNSSSFFGSGRKNSKSNSKSTPNRTLSSSQVPPPVSLFAPRRRSAPIDTLDENQPYQPGMLLQDRPPVSTAVSSDEEEVYDFPEEQQIRPSISVSEESSEIGSLKTMLQQQQAMIRQVLSKQEAIETKQAAFEQKLTELERKSESVNASSPPSSGHSGSGRKRRRVVSHEISRLVSMKHENLKPEDKFQYTESFASAHNKTVRSCISDELSKDPNCKFSPSIITAAVKRHFENVRRNYKEKQDGMEDYVEEQAKKRRYRSRRDRTFQKRASVVKDGELERWNQLSYQYMTEESDDPDEPNNIVVRKLEWRSETLNKYMKILDTRLSKIATREVAGNVAKKIRILGEPSLSGPPPEAPCWAMKRVTSLEREDPLEDITNTTV